ncbi:nucleotidyltransferase family protein [Acidocella facilis]|uniref:nucleotidyltransferase family protein n=1 Tax=Acidocella facilis TaxID=525 RepID=UPI00047D691F|nr:nucleotidyltransferase family protein [Acidocella facilis]
MRFAVLVLAAGASRRMGAENKLLLALASGQSILRTVLERAVAAQIGPVLLVTGHEAARVAGEADGLPVKCVHAAEHEEGMAASLRAGIAAVPEDCAGAVVCLGDMPFVPSAVLRELAGAFASPLDIVQPVFEGRPGNPVLWGRAHFGAMMGLHGDQGAKRLLAQPERLQRITVTAPGVLQDVDTPEAYAAILGQ